MGERRRSAAHLSPQFGFTLYRDTKSRYEARRRHVTILPYLASRQPILRGRPLRASGNGEQRGFRMTIRIVPAPARPVLWSLATTVAALALFAVPAAQAQAPAPAPAAPAAPKAPAKKPAAPKAPAPAAQAPAAAPQQ